MQRRFHTLEGLRGVAAVAVVLFHLGGAWRAVFSHAYLAVDLFFLISGVVIGHAYDLKLRNGWRAGDFMAARLRRLAPLYFLGLLIGVVFALVRVTFAGADMKSLPFDLMLGAAFIPQLFGNQICLFPLDYPCWSLFTEISANLAYALTARVLSKRFLVVSVCFGLILLIGANTWAHGNNDMGTTTANWLGGFARVGFGFPLGLLLNRAQIEGRLPRWSVAPPILLTFVGATFVFPWHGLYNDLIIIVLVYPALIVAALNSEPESFGTNRLFGLAGFISYPLYVLHVPFIDLFDSFLTGRGLLWLLLKLGFVGALIILAYLIARFVDEPVRSWLRQRRPASRRGWADAPLSQ